MSTIKDGGPAFAHGNHEQGGSSGMSLRDWFAGQALVGCIKAEESTDVDSLKERDRIRQRNHRAKAQAAKRAYEVADAMLAAREVQS